ncbi:hypothetical protein CEE37_04790 [candidate division LCP-89 bacterium B3_LCP]|uniref:Glycosyltransferase 2-like domain-containing protein n=1 Tax=candidate division LCP-89 bacterium B3_LCP TaxID=2012998 RepID=A0A532V404_UNCL8|nr:MAG: hypothetical protein CEE37_04790 [candidate division LCP-89 bacterium B3_LCP]
MSSTSIVIPAYNASSTLPKVLGGLLSQNVRDFEVVLVDDASIDDTSQVAKTFSGDLNLHIYKLDENRGRAGCRNYGVDKANGEIILLLDSDIEATPDYVSTHLQLHEQKDKAVGVGAQRFPDLLAKQAFGRYYIKRGGARLKPGQTMPGRYFASGLASFRRSTFVELGGFDTNFTVYGGEDLELGLRFVKAGSELVFLPQAVAYHHHLRPLKEIIRKLEVYGEHSIPLILKKHPEVSAELHLDDLTQPTGKTWKHLFMGAATNGVFYKTLLGVASLCQSFLIPSPLLTYLIYSAYRRGFVRTLS